ncbi:MAG TPA: BON domain-containing protein [Woeseiaceae bacterium]|nr:BON domain-containing protein [Woeseiaceae bacterium]
MKTAILIACLCLVTSACSSMLMGGSASGTTGLGKDNRTAQQLADDNAITATIRSRYAQDSAISAAKLSIETYMGAVTLKGTVPSFAVRDRAVSIARNTDKVRSVNNQIAVNTNNKQ